MRSPPKAVVVVSVLAGAAAATGVAFATIPGSDGVIHACYATNGSGTVNVIDPTSTDASVPTSCVKGQASFAFNQTGPPGPPGSPGPAGPPGGDPPGADIETVAFIVLMEASKSADQDLKQITSAVEKTNHQRRTMRTAIGQLIRETNLLRAHKGTVAGVLRAMKNVNDFLARAPCVTHAAQPCR